MDGPSPRHGRRTRISWFDNCCSTNGNDNDNGDADADGYGDANENDEMLV